MYFSLLARIPEFFIGGIFALIFNKRINFNNKVNNILAFLSLIILLTCSFLINELSPFPGILALIPCLTGVLLLSLKDNKISAFFSSKPLVYIGELSYSLYLWHFPIMALVRYKNDRYEFNWHEIIVISLLTFVLAYLSYNFVEQKFKRFSTKNIILLLGGLFLITNLYAYKVKNVFVANKIDNMYSRRSFGSESHGKDFVQKFGSSKSNDKILLIGDSHARSLKSFFDEIGRKNNFSFQTITCDSYPALKGISRKDIEKNESDGINFYETSLKLIDTTEKLIDESEVIILAIIGIDRPNSEYMAIENLCTNLKENQKLILVNSYPTLERDPLKINNGYIQINNTQIERESNLKTKSTLYKLANKYKNVFIFNLDTEAINKNLGYINDTVIYYDRRHLNEFGAKKLVDEHEIKFVELLNN